MATLGLQGDVNNSIQMTGAYPIGRTYGYVPASGTDFSMRNNYSGELGGLNQDYRGGMQMISPNAQMTNARESGITRVNGNGNVNGKKPAAWWITFAITFVIIAWLARRYAPDGENFAIIKPNLINGLFLTLWIVLILAFLKQVAARIKVPGLSDLILSV